MSQSEPRTPAEVAAHWREIFYRHTSVLLLAAYKGTQDEAVDSALAAVVAAALEREQAGREEDRAVIDKMDRNNVSAWFKIAGLQAELAAKDAALAEAWKTAKEEGMDVGILPCKETSLDAMICAIGDKYVELLAAKDAEIAELKKQSRAHRVVFAWAYQFAGAYDAPAWILDILSAAAQGERLPHELKAVDPPQSALPPNMTPEKLEELAFYYEHDGFDVNILREWAAWLRAKQEASQK